MMQYSMRSDAAFGVVATHNQGAPPHPRRRALAHRVKREMASSGPDLAYDDRDGKAVQ